MIDGFEKWQELPTTAVNSYYVIGRTAGVLSPILERRKCCRPCHSYNMQLSASAGPVLLPLSWLSSLRSTCHYS